MSSHWIRPQRLSLVGERQHPTRCHAMGITFQTPHHRVTIPVMHLLAQVHFVHSLNRCLVVLYKESISWDRRDGSTLRDTCCFCRGLEFSSQHPQSSSQPPVTPGDPMPFSDFHGHYNAYGPPKYMQASTHVHKTNL